MPPSERAGATLTIDLAAIVDNYRRLRAQARGAACAAVVKANAYGLGVERVAPALAGAGCRQFFVATLEEGVILRALVESADIAVLAGVGAGEAGVFLAHRLMPVLNDPAQIEHWRKACADAPRAPAILHLDTGMNRLGLSTRDIERLIEEPERVRGLPFAFVMSHLAAAEESANPLNEDQRRRFDDARGRLAALLGNPRASLANSSGAFLGPAYHYDLLRPGAALYGINPTPGALNPMRACLKLDARIVQWREIDRPSTVGYGATHAVAPGQKIATVAAGYADGIPRSLSNRGYGVLAGKRVPLVGRVSMDLITFDVTALARQEALPGTAITLIGADPALDGVAAAAGTIGYEILTRLGPRYHRRYTGP